MLLWSYFTCLLTDPGRVPPRWSPFSDDVEAAAVLEGLDQGSLDGWGRTDVQRPRFCKKCQVQQSFDLNFCICGAGDAAISRDFVSVDSASRC